MVKKLLLIVFFLSAISLWITLNAWDSKASTFLSRNTSPGLLDIGQYCTISWIDPAPASQSCKSPYICRSGQTAAAQCLEVPTSGSLQNGENCLSNAWCQSGYCQFFAGYTGVSTCQVKCSTATCNGTCIVQTSIKEYPPGYPADINQCIANTPTPTPNPCLTSTNKPNNCSCTQPGTTTQCASGYCGGNIETQGGLTCRNPVATATPTRTPTPSPTSTQSNNDPTAIPTITTLCNPDKTGTSVSRIDDLDFLWWKLEFIGTKITKDADCKTDQIIDIFDFNKMRDARKANGWQ